MEIVNVEEFSCDRSRTCCFTGHRRRDLPFKGSLNKFGMRRLLSVLRLMIEEAYREGYNTFMSGMADGIDIYCAKMVWEMKNDKKNDDIQLICAIPYEEQAKEVTDALDVYYYSIILNNCDVKVVVSNQKDRNRYKARNQFMVNNSSMVIGAFKYKPTGSGTLQTINMAKRANLDLRIVNMDENPEFYYECEKKCKF